MSAFGSRWSSRQVAGAAGLRDWAPEPGALVTFACFPVYTAGLFRRFFPEEADTHGRWIYFFFFESLYPPLFTAFFPSVHKTDLSSFHYSFALFFLPPYLVSALAVLPEAERSAAPAPELSGSRRDALDLRAGAFGARHPGNLGQGGGWWPARRPAGYTQGPQLSVKGSCVRLVA